MQLAVIADIHGNLLALRAVLADIARRGIGQTVDLGDSVSGPLWPRESLELLQSAGIPTLRGNHDRWVAEGGAGSWDAFARAQLGPAQAAWLGALPPQREPLPGLLAFHARPEDDNAYLLEEVADGRMVPATAETVAARLGPTEASLILCAHSHRAGLLRLPDGRVVVNPGSVGCPAYADPTPPAHVSESGAPFARYAVLEVEAGRLLGAEFVAVGYDHAAAAARAEAQGQPAWAHALRTGLMPQGAA
ncbi:metallophosphoesterase family protein [Paracraurococcus lichenis]|uniref:Metallophosphoesterase family protein n=1 Tax=Paracraurococcus lichenis TaxID=3064888 RepID=A0ABT9DYI4_9PROT|nr:metallophosphoesterase family protein [Paracraurococcus sp. LOR1-02]MDO9708957.1 metallophosphoesterase family protein [Paracraurococcus sp. LOR1-02]